MPRAQSQSIDVRPPAPRARVLCIDSDRRITDFLAGVLERDGFDVEWAHDGPTGLASALAGTFDALVLERALPGLEGIELLRRIRRESVATPAILLTAFPTIDSAIEATKLGAVYVTKAQTSAAAIVDAVRAVTRSATNGHSALFGTGCAQPITHIELPCDPSGQDETESRTHRLRQLLAHRLVQPGLTFFDFADLARAFRRLSQPGRMLPSASDAEHSPRREWSLVDPRAKSVVLRMEQAGNRWARLDERALAAQLSMAPAALWRLLRDQLGQTFRECRRTVVMRRASREIFGGDEQIAQIAYGLGYEHPSSFDRDFRRFLRIAPTRFRGLTREESDKE